MRGQWQGRSSSATTLCERWHSEATPDSRRPRQLVGQQVQSAWDRHCLSSRGFAAYGSGGDDSCCHLPQRGSKSLARSPVWQAATRSSVLRRKRKQWKGATQLITDDSPDRPNASYWWSISARGRGQRRRWTLAAQGLPEPREPKGIRQSSCQSSADCSYRSRYLIPVKSICSISTSPDCGLRIELAAGRSRLPVGPCTRCQPVSLPPGTGRFYYGWTASYASR
jgi:hypothetical protein